MRPAGRARGGPPGAPDASLHPMRQVVQLLPDDARRIPWRNGRGFTDELALAPPGASFERGDFTWRISRATLAEGGPFSSFPGFERVLVIVAGDGLVLAHGDSAPRARLRLGEPYRFSGSWTTTAELIGGAVADFNVIYRPELVRAEVQPLRLGTRRSRESLAGGDAFLHVLTGSLKARVTGEELPYELAAGGSLWGAQLKVGDELELSGTADGTFALLVRLELARGGS